MSVVDLAARKRVGTIVCGEYRRPHDVALDGRGGLYILSEGTSTLLVSRDPQTCTVGGTIPTGGRGSHKVSVLRDGSIAFVSHMYSDTVTALFPADPQRPPVTIRVTKRPEGSALDSEERRLFVVNREAAELSVIDVQRLATADAIPTPKGPVRICRTPEGLLLAALYYDCGLAIIDPNLRGSVRVVPVPEKPISVGYHAASRTALLSTRGHRLVLVDTVAARLLRFIPTRLDPDPMVVLPLPA